MESPLIKKSWKRGMNSVDVVYPNLYYGGVYCLGPLILYNVVNARKNWVCNRVFLDRGKITSKLVGFTLQYELDCHNVLEILKKNEIPLEKEREQIVFAGGPFVNVNPKAMSRYFDFFIIGECEEMLVKVMEAYENHKRKKDFLNSIAKLKGVFVPGISKSVVPVNVTNLDNVPYPLYQPLPGETGKEFVFGKVFMLEIERGCPFICKFCPMPNFYGKVRHRSLSAIKGIIDEGIRINQRKKVVIYSASFTHPKRKDILRYLLEKELGFSVPSLKVDIVDEELMALIRKGGQRTLTIAPECNESLRKKVCKNVSDKKFFDFVEAAGRIGFEGIKLYFMVGLPEQDTRDLDEMAELIKKLKNSFKGKSYVSVNPFVPKPGTAFANHVFDVKLVKRQVSYLKKKLGKMGIRFKFAGVKNALLEWKIANADDFPISQ
jgi:radical SAM superfamily enzyme YgiQ (UPF0313 family)